MQHDDEIDARSGRACKSRVRKCFSFIEQNLVTYSMSQQYLICSHHRSSWLLPRRNKKPSWSFCAFRPPFTLHKKSRRKERENHFLDVALSLKSLNMENLEKKLKSFMWTGMRSVLQCIIFSNLYRILLLNRCSDCLMQLYLAQVERRNRKVFEKQNAFRWWQSGFLLRNAVLFRVIKSGFWHFVIECSKSNGLSNSCCFLAFNSCESDWWCTREKRHQKYYDIRLHCHWLW